MVGFLGEIWWKFIGHGVVVLLNLGTNGMTAKSWALVTDSNLTRLAGSRY